MLVNCLYFGGDNVGHFISVRLVTPCILIYATRSSRGCGVVFFHIHEITGAQSKA